MEVVCGTSSILGTYCLIEVRHEVFLGHSLVSCHSLVLLGIETMRNYAQMTEVSLIDGPIRTPAFTSDRQSGIFNGPTPGTIDSSKAPCKDCVTRGVDTVVFN